MPWKAQSCSRALEVLLCELHIASLPIMANSYIMDIQGHMDQEAGKLAAQPGPDLEYFVILVTLKAGSVLS